MLDYIFKFSISLTVLYVFYRAVLRPLTFYRWNRFYLLGYALLSFVIPLVDVDHFVDQSALSYQHYISYIPSVGYISGIAALQTIPWWKAMTAADWLLIAFAAGVTVMLIRLMLQMLALRRFRQKSRLLSNENGVALYETDAKAVPFSFGRSIFINPSSHSREELERIIQHEFVHVRQQHSIDLLVAELLCIVNWFNPFAWLIRHAIRQNLEFLADDQVLRNGIEKKDYQYLLLKVTGNARFAVAGHFNLSSLKKRIVMMNKIKTARLNAARFMFVLPLLALSLAAFRNYKEQDEKTVWLAGILVDAQSHQPLPDARVQLKGSNISATSDKRGYYELEIPYQNKPLSFALQVTSSGYQPFQQTENWGNFYEDYIRKRYRYSFEFFGLTKNEGGFSRLMNAAESRHALNYDNALQLLQQVFAEQPANIMMTADTVQGKTDADLMEVNITRQDYKDGATGKYTSKVTVTHADGKQEQYDLTKPSERAAYEKKYGKLELPSPPPPPAAGSVKERDLPPPPPPANGVRKKGSVPPAPPLPASKKQSAAPIAPVTPVQPVDAAAPPPLYYIDGKEAAPETVKKVLADSIESVNVWKGDAARSRYGDKGTHGVVEIHTKQGRKNSLPKDVLLVIDGVEMPAGSNIDEMVAPGDIDHVGVLTGNEATLKYGEKGKKGVVEIVTKRKTSSQKIVM